VVKEAMRLYPPPWVLGREAVEDCALGGFDIPAGSQVYACPYWTHRNPNYFPNPERFWPERWGQDTMRQLPRFAYMPFGGGQRICIGQQFAMMELCIALATIVARFELALLEPSPAHQPAFTLRPRDGIRVAVRRIAFDPLGAP
jgi:cytochrome P450